MEEIIKCKIHSILFQNTETGYTVARAFLDEKHLFTITGIFHSLYENDMIKIKGNWVTHPKYGEQFAVNFYETLLPDNENEIERFLSSRILKGIGKTLGKRIVEKFGDDTFKILDSNMERLLEVNGIGKSKLKKISSSWAEHREAKDNIIFLQGIGVGITKAMKIYKMYGKDTIAIIKENPYKLADDIHGIGFLNADKIAHNLGLAEDSNYRIEAAVLYQLQLLTNEGHVFYPRNKLINKCSTLIYQDRDLIYDAVNRLEKREKIFIESSFKINFDDSDYPVYSANLYKAEVGISEYLKTFHSASLNFNVPNLNEVIKKISKSLNISFAEKQFEAVQASFQNKLLIITGGPGTGKTTIINTILKIYQKLNKKVILAAPTGRAAKRMAEATDYEAQTIHRLLEYNPIYKYFNRNGDNPLETDLIILDEVSMIDTLLFFHFLQAIPPEASLILVGDVDQLPSVGAGNVLKDLIGSRILPTIRLKKIFRQTEKSSIITNAHRVNMGNMPIVTNEETSDFFFARIKNPKNILERVVNLCKDGISSKFNFDPFSDIQVIAPMYKGTVGITNLNSKLQETLNPNGKEIKIGSGNFRVGDKVMQVKNNYEKDIYNGDIGRIESYDKSKRSIIVNFDEHIVSYESSESDELVLAYAISVHKSQGSEYPVIIMPIIKEHYRLLQRNLIYTAISRGKRLVILLGDEQALAFAVKNNKSQKRFTLLETRLRN